jgi:prepilin-type N-terminal cleavage/methylation domain-containing protein
MLVLKSKKGMTLVEVMLAILILTIVILGSALLYVYGLGHISLSKNYRVATELAAQKLEQFEADNHYHIDIPAGETTEGISLGGVSFTRDTTTEDLGLYKKVKVTINWTQNQRLRDVSLVTLYVNR